MTVHILTDPAYQKMVEKRLESLKEEKTPLSQQISEAEAKRSEPSEKNHSERIMSER